MKFVHISLFLFLILITPFLANGDDEKIAHECGVALVRLRKPIPYYAKHYGDPAWGAVKLLSLMEKQRNRGQDGVGISVVKSEQHSLESVRAIFTDAFNTITNKVMQNLHEADSPFIGEVYLGHLRYATYGGMQLDYCQPFVHSHEMACRHFSIAGNFNMTNMSQLRQQLKEWGRSPTNESDMQVVLNMVAHHLETTADLAQAIKNAAVGWDGGYIFLGALANGEVFTCHDPAGIRPGYYFVNEEVFAAASEKGALMAAFDVQEKEILSIKPGHIMVVKSDGTITDTPFTFSLPKRSCIFERIYFSKPTDPTIYKERKALGHNLALKVFNELKGDIKNAVFTYVPNSGLLAFQGLIEEIAKLSQHTPRVEFIIEKKKKLRTFITPDQGRNELVAQSYDVTKGIIKETDTLVIVEDSIVRGTTLRESIIKNIITLNPKKIIVVSSSPVILYPDCYGIDMSQIGNFVGFRAALLLLKEKGKAALLDKVRELCLKQKNAPPSQMRNEVKRIYEPFTLEEISNKVAEFVTPAGWEGSIQVIYQSVEGLHEAIGGHYGDWYFSGNYPTPGGLAVLNNSYSGAVATIPAAINTTYLCIF